MLYAVLCYDNEAAIEAWAPHHEAAAMARLVAIEDRLYAEGRVGAVVRLAPTSVATTIRKSGEPIVLDGPFAETKEQLLGFYVIECPTLGDAIEVGKELAVALGTGGSYELRPLRSWREGRLK